MELSGFVAVPTSSLEELANNYLAELERLVAYQRERILRYANKQQLRYESKRRWFILPPRKFQDTKEFVKWFSQKYETGPICKLKRYEEAHREFAMKWLRAADSRHAIQNKTLVSIEEFNILLRLKINVDVYWPTRNYDSPWFCVEEQT